MNIVLPGFSVRLKQLRSEKHMTQREMAALLGCTERHYQKIEYGEIDADIRGDERQNSRRRLYERIRQLCHYQSRKRLSDAVCAYAAQGAGERRAACRAG